MILLLVLAVVSSSYAERPCAPRQVEGESVVCVCNATYCDDLVRQEPAAGGFVAYESSAGGKRFFKTVGTQDKLDEKTSFNTSIELDTNHTYQIMKGFGGSVTDAAGINWKSMSETLQQKLIDTYFGESGIGYSFIRVPIGGCDFSTHPYAYNELPENDAKLSNFSLAYEDYHYKIPMIKAAMQASRTAVWVLGSVWSPPTWMKTNNHWYGFSILKEEYYQTYADYYLKFIEKYNEEGIPIWGITTTNEPSLGIIPLTRFNSLGFFPPGMATFIADNLGPTIRNSSFNKTLILAVDDQRFTIPIWFNWVIKLKPETLNWIDGFAVHFYGDALTPAAVLDIVTKHSSNKFLLATEACAGSYPLDKAVVLGSWNRARLYILDIIEDVNYGVDGWIDWNMCLNSHGGPNWAWNYVDSPIIISDDQQEFWKQPMFYAMGHFAKFVPRGSQRIAAETSGDKLYSAAFVTPRNTVVVVVYNDHNRAKKVRLQLKDKQVIFEVSKKSIATVELTSFDTSIELDTNHTYQIMKGFGGSVTDAAGINWKNMSETLQQKLIDTYFGESGIGYSFIRVPIGGCDFSTHPYAYNELPENDAKLSNFSLAYEDYHYKIPMIKAAMQASRTDVWVLGSVWSPPTWMKTNNHWYGVSRLKKEYYQTYADYYLKFIEKYNEEGIPIWGITTTNEPTIGVIPVARFNSLGFDPHGMATFIVANLGPTIRNSRFNSTLILAVDDHRFTILIWFHWVIAANPETLNWIDGVAVHSYSNFLTPTLVLDTVTKHYPEMLILSTEASTGTSPFEEKVILGSWRRAREYIMDIMENVKNGVGGWIDWNMCLNTQGGPNWSGNFVDSPIIVSDDQQEFWKQPMFYAIGHFAKFVPRGSQRIAAEISGEKLLSAAFVTPRNTVVTVIYNGNTGASKVRIQLKDKQIILEVAKNSIATVELSQ